MARGKDEEEMKSLALNGPVISVSVARGDDMKVKPSPIASKRAVSVSFIHSSFLKRERGDL